MFRTFSPLKPRRLWRRQVVSPLRRVALRGGSALRQWLSPQQNPFLTRAWRTETRRHQPLATAALTMALIVVANFAAWQAWLYLLGQNRFLRNQGYSATHLPDAIGGNFIGFFALVTACVCVLAALFCARLRALALLRKELLGSTLDSLQLLPIREERWLWLMSAHPFLLSMLIGVCGLPVFALAIWTDNWSLLDLCGLFLVFVWIGHIAPLWTPVSWKQDGARASQKVTWRSWRAQMSADAVELPRALTEASQNPQMASYLARSNSLEASRRRQRVMLGAAPAPSSTSDATSSTRSGAAPQDKAASGNDKTDSSRKSKQRAQGNWFVSLFGFYYLFKLAFTLLRLPFLSVPSQLLASLRSDIFAAWPESVRAIWPGFVLTWPLLFARIALSPLPFFRVQIAPIWVLALLWLGFSSLRNRNLASLVSSSETFWTPRRARDRSRTARLMWQAGIFSMLGFAWPTFIARGEMATLLGTYLPSTDLALAALWTLFLIVATLLSARQAVAVLGRAALLLEAPVEENARWQALVWRQAALRVLDAFVWPLVAYFALCAIGENLPWSASWLARLAPTLFIALAFLVAVFGSATLVGAVSGPLRSALKCLRWLWFWGLPLEIGLLLVIAAFTRTPFSLDQVPHTVFSPTVSLLSLLQNDVSKLGGIDWTTIAGVQFSVGICCLALAWTTVFRAVPRGAVAQTVVQSERARTPLEQIGGALWTPFRLVGSVFTFITNGFVRFSDAVKQRIERVNERIIARGTKVDNAVFTSELRRRVRKTNWCRQWLWLSAVAFALFSIGFVLPLLAEASSRVTYHEMSWSEAIAATHWDDYGGSLLIVTGGITLLGAVISVLNTGQAFDRDRANGTLVFLFLTPMSDRAILWGKVAFEALYSSLLLSVVVPYSLLGFVLSLQDGMAAWWILILGVPFVVALAAFAIFVNLLFAVRARKPSEGSAKALLALIVFEFMLVGLANLLQATTSILFAFLLIVLHLAAAFVCYRLALMSFRKLRYGDIAVGGKMAT